MKKHFYLLIAAMMALLFSFAACGGDDDVKVKGVSLNKTAASIAVNASETLVVNFEPSNPKNQTVSWASSNTSVATVTDGGTIRGVAPGTSNVTVSTEQGDFKATCVVTVFIPPATGVALSKTSTSIIASLDERLTATVTPSGANQTVTWQSSNIAVAQVAREGNGTVIATAPGEAIITATTLDGKHTASCAVTVMPLVIDVTGVTVVPPSLTLLSAIPNYPAGTAQMTAIATPPIAPPAQQVLTWSSSDTAVATASPTGFVEAVAAGSVEIRATAANGVVGACALTVADPVRVTGVTVESDSSAIQAGQPLRLLATLTPSNATYKDVTWSCAPADIAQISPAGSACIVTGQRAGPATVTVTTVDGSRTANFNVTFTPAPVTGVSMRGYTEVLIGGTVQLTPTVLPSYAENKAVTWDSDKKDIADVSATGLVTAKAIGSAVITVTTLEGGFEATCKVDVVSELANIYMAGSYVDLRYSGALSYSYPAWAKNGESWILDNTEGYGNAYSISVADDGSVYKGGSTDNITYGILRVAIWKDGQFHQYLDNPRGDATGSVAYSMFISGNEIYAAGYVQDAPGFWKDNVITVLPYTLTGVARSIAVSNGIAYVVGYDMNDSWASCAMLWKEGEPPTVLYDPAGALNSDAYSVFVSGGSVYIAMRYNVDYQEYWAVWKDGVLTTYPLVQGAMRQRFESIFVANGKVYVAGTATFTAYSTAVLWEDGVPLLLHRQDPDYDSEASCVYVYNDNVYVSGLITSYVDNVITRYPTVWINGEPTTISMPASPLPTFSDDDYILPRAIFVTSK